MTTTSTVNDHYERQLERIAARFGVTLEQLLEAIDADGPDPERVFERLERRAA